MNCVVLLFSQWRNTHYHDHVLGVFSSQEEAKIMIDRLMANPKFTEKYKGIDGSQVTSWQFFCLEGEMGSLLEGVLN